MLYAVQPDRAEHGAAHRPRCPRTSTSASRDCSTRTFPAAPSSARTVTGTAAASPPRSATASSTIVRAARSMSLVTSSSGGGAGMPYAVAQYSGAENAHTTCRSAPRRHASSRAKAKADRAQSDPSMPATTLGRR